MIKLIIFDWDDVITLGAKEGYFACYRQAINAVGTYLSPEEEYNRILAKWGKSFREELRELLREKPELVDTACKIFEKAYWSNTFVDSLAYLPQTSDMLLRLKNNYILAVATGNQQKMIQEVIMPHFNIPNVFSQMITSHEITDQTKTKPHPYMLETIMYTQGVKPEETIFVGDAKTDVQMAQSAYVTPIVVLTGQLNKQEAEALKVPYILKEVTELESILQKLK